MPRRPLPLATSLGIIAWGNSGETLLQKVQVAQNKILRIINFKCLKDRVKMLTLYKDMKILQVKDTFEIEVAKFMHSFRHGCHVQYI